MLETKGSQLDSHYSPQRLVVLPESASNGTTTESRKTKRSLVVFEAEVGNFGGSAMIKKFLRHVIPRLSN